MTKLRLKRWKFVSLFLGILIIILIALPVQGAKRIYITNDFLNFSVSVKALEIFAEEGKIVKELAFFLNYLNPQQQVHLREFLRTRYDINPVRLYKLGNSYAGNQLLTVLGKAIQLPGGRNGYYAIRGSIIYSATTPEGLSIINVLRNFSTDVQLNIDYIFQSLQKITNLIKKTNTFIESIKQTDSVDSQPLVDFQLGLDLRQSGQFSTSKKVLKLQDNQRDRSLKVFLYLPQTENADIPIIFISNGLGASGDHFDFLAHHLASHGFAVVIPDHPNSNGPRQTDFYDGFYKDPFDAMEFIDRPLDITFVLDYLQQVNSTQFQGQLNFEKVGIFGYSFGGTTALALGGAQINFEQLQKDCNPPDSLTNISILYQCRALEIPQQPYQLEDNRIQAAFVFVPFGKSLYGQSQMSRVTMPIFWQATSEDVITPLLIEQIPAFSWLPNQNKYLMISEKLPHAKIILDVMNRLMNRQLSAEKVEQVSQDYLNALTLAFFKIYIAQDERYLPYLQSYYITQVLREEPFNLFLVKQDRLQKKFP